MAGAEVLHERKPGDDEALSGQFRLAGAHCDAAPEPADNRTQDTVVTP